MGLLRGEYAVSWISHRIYRVILMRVFTSTDGYVGFNYASVNYIEPGAPDYIYYVRKHNPCAIHNSIANNP
jgi:hypothetical protein